MKALRVSRFGLENLALDDVAEPEPARGEVLLRLRAAFNRGERLSEYGEKPVDQRLELRVRWHF